MWLVRAALRFRITVAVVAIVIVVMASLSARQMKADVLPSIDIPVVVVVWGYPGLSAEDMERRIVLVSERAYSSTVSGISRIESRSINGIGLLRIYFEPNANVAAAISQVSSISQTVTRLMPTGTLPPTVLQYSASNVPIAQLTVSSSSDTVPEQQLFDYGQNTLRVRLFTIPGLSTPLPYGGKARQIMVNVDPAALSARAIAPQDVVRALLDSNLTVPAGTARIGDTEYDVSINNSPNVVDEFNRIPLKLGNATGPGVRLGDVAKVEDGFAVQQNIVRVDGQRATYLTIMKKNDASTIAVIDSARALLPQIRASAPPGVELRLDFDQSSFVRTAMRGVVSEAIVAAALVSFLMLLFLGSWRSALLVATSIPLSIGGALIGLKLAGQTINLMTVGGLALAIGLLVDDATVEVENIHRNRVHLGKPLLEAIESGAREVARPALAATLAICMVFAPVFLMEGAAKFLFTPLAMAVIFSMLTSYVLSRTLVPALASVLLASEPVRVDARKSIGSQIFSVIGSVYDATLRFALGHRAISLAACLLILLGLGGFAAKRIGVEFFPEVDTGQMRLHVRAPIGTRIEKTEEIVSNIESRIRAVIPARDLQTINDNIGVPNPLNLAFVPTDNIGSQDADLFIALRPGHAKSTAFYKERLREELARAYPEVRAYFQPADLISQALSFGSSAPIDVGVEGPDIEKSAEIAVRLRDQMRAIPGLVDTRVAQVLDHPALQIDVDREHAARLGLTQRDVADNMLTSLSSSGLVAPSFWLNPNNGVSYLVAVQTPIQKVESIPALMATPITGARADSTVTMNDPFGLGGKRAPAYLGSVSALRASQTKALISHETIQRVVNVHAGVEGRDLGSVSRQVDQLVAAASRDLPPGTRIVARGEAKAMFGAFHDLAWGLALALVLVYLLLVVLFQSWLEALVIMVAVPGALAGASVMLAATHTRFNVESFMGVIMSVGVAVSNSILLVNSARLLRQEARHRDAPLEALREAGRTRLRPVMMTVLAMVGGMLPLAVSTSEGAEQNAPLARAVIGGLVLSTAVTLFVVPLVYSLLIRRRVASPMRAEETLVMPTSTLLEAR